MTPNELLTLIGRAWPRLLIYPGGIAAFSLIWLLARTTNQEPRTGDYQGIASSWFLFLGSAIVPPWLGIALLPLPLAVDVGRQFDAVMTLGLLELPLLLTTAVELRSAEQLTWRRGARRLAAALNGYPALVLALMLLGANAGSLELDALARLPAEQAAPVIAGLHWAGAVMLALALPPVLGIGPFATPLPASQALRIGLRLRGIGLALLSLLPWLALARTPFVLPPLPQFEQQPWLLPAPPIVLALLIWGYHRATRGRAPRAWAWTYLLLDLLLLLALLASAGLALQQRLA